jgi:aspartate/tyrosine/aromatic aminotransferase
MASMAGRIAGVRGELQAALEKRCPDKDWSFITQQIGMFSFTGMTPQQVGCLGAPFAWHGVSIVLGPAHAAVI